jgi:hypothetical protein
MIDTLGSDTNELKKEKIRISDNYTLSETSCGRRVVLLVLFNHKSYKTLLEKVLLVELSASRQ